ncbi:MAG: acetyl-CoA carboxylase biotin carboxyl carrier protein subunit [Pseudomonadota bacterium]|nr:acetyl-CoA carboxylase biotin carboxyl carrier protein subunit [Pseudomonadota bacterium]
MYFQAEQKGIKWEINVNETRTHWSISLKPETKDWSHYEMPKSSFLELDNAISFIHNNSSYVFDVVGSGTDYTVYARGSYRVIKIFNDEMLLHESLKQDGGLVGSDKLSAGMPGKITKVFAEEGKEVKKDQPLLIMEAMKMENEIRSPKAALIKKVFVKEGDVVESGAALISFEKSK